MRGNRLTKAIVNQVVHLFRLDRASTLVLLLPEPQLPTGEYMDDGPDRDAAMARLRKAYGASGFTPWQDSDVMWEPIEPPKPLLG